MLIAISHATADDDGPDKGGHDHHRPPAAGRFLVLVFALVLAISGIEFAAFGLREAKVAAAWLLIGILPEIARLPGPIGGTQFRLGIGMLTVGRAAMRRLRHSLGRVSLALHRHRRRNRADRRRGPATASARLAAEQIPARLTPIGGASRRNVGLELRRIGVGLGRSPVGRIGPGLQFAPLLHSPAAAALAAAHVRRNPAAEENRPESPVPVAAGHVLAGCCAWPVWACGLTQDGCRVNAPDLRGGQRAFRCSALEMRSARTSRKPLNIGRRRSCA